MLLKAIIITMLKIHLNEIHFLKIKISQFKSESLNEIYCTCVINKVKKMFIYNVNENIKKCSAMHVKSMLLKLIIITVQKMHLDKIHFLKDRISQFKSEKLRSHNDETSTY